MCILTSENTNRKRLYQKRNTPATSKMVMDHNRFTRYGRKVMRLIFYLSKFLFFSNINVIAFKVVPLGNYTPTETLFPLLVTAPEVFNQYDLQYVRYTLLNVF